MKHIFTWVKVMQLERIERLLLIWADDTYSRKVIFLPGLFHSEKVLR